MSKPSRFFDLPAELRNQIYEYVLTSADGPLYYREPHSLNSLTKPIFEVSKRLRYIKAAVKPASEFNRLQYVNRQLHKETGALELKYNTLTFTCDHDDDKASSQLLSFLKSLSPSHALWPLKISVEDWVGRGRYVKRPAGDYYPFTDTIERIEEVSQCCRHSPHLHITWNLSRLRVKGRTDIDYQNFVSRALQLLYLTRTRTFTDLYKIAMYENWDIQDAGEEQKGMSAQDLNAENLVFMPTVKRFDEEEWRAAVQGRRLQKKYHPDKLYAMVEEWCTKGI